MIAVGNFTFKSFKEREAGSFTNIQTGEVIEYTASHILKFDEELEDGDIRERKAKVELDNHELIQKLLKVKSYQPITLKFKVNLCKDGSFGFVKLIDAIVPENEKQKNQEEKSIQ
ncbi:MAG: hypothetical protein IJK18_04400 [Clostridia bacterium]|nr:hypothetical protein [Clostridia bacterium]